MANAVYPGYKEAVLTGAANSALTGAGTTGLYCALVDTAFYTYNASHIYYTSLAGIAADQEITAVTTTNGVVDGNNVTFMSVAAGLPLEALVLYRKNAGVSSTWRLVCYLDSGVVSGLPVTPGGGNIVVTWGASGIFSL